MRHLMNITDLSVEEINKLIETAQDIIKNKEKYVEMCKGKQLATLFFEPSTRTRLSFESAMLSLGGSVLGFSSANSSSTAKGECVADTVRTVSSYVDIIAMRHPKEGAPVAAKETSLVPIINAGDGGHNHPTQTLTDLLTIVQEKGELNNLTIGLCGDLKYGRTVHSLIAAMSRYNNIKLVLISPKELELPDYIVKDVLEKNNMEYNITNSLEEHMEELDVLYMTRIQKERFASEEEYERLKGCYILDNAKLQKAKDSLCIMHPLPRVNEIAKEVDKDPRAAYFRQVQYGKYIRMALILKLINSKNETIESHEEEIKLNERCSNPHCITMTETDLEPLFVLANKGKNIYKCKYCETSKKIN